MTTRSIVQIDEEKCDGCGQCIPNCAEGALRIVDGKARLVSDRFCDGLGACLGVCPRDAIRVVEREAEDFDEEAAVQHVKESEQSEAPRAPEPAMCPGLAAFGFGAAAAAPAATDSEADAVEEPSALSQWPVQLTLVPERAPFFDGADLLLAADCTAFALPDFHRRLLRGRKLLVGCPKLDDAGRYEQKLAAILRSNAIASLTVVHMEVPCCFGLVALARLALAACGKDIPLGDVTVGVRGGVTG